MAGVITKWDPERFLDAYYENGGYIVRAARVVGVNRTTVEYHRRHNAKFAREWRDVDEQLALEAAERGEVEVAHYRQNHPSRGKTQFRNWKPTFLKCLGINGCVTHAAHAAGVAVRTAYLERQKDEEFAVAWANAIEHSTEELEAEGIRRALNTSDLLLMFFLKARKPHLYRENAQIWKTELDEQNVATIVDAVRNAATTAGLDESQFSDFAAELETELRRFEKSAK